VRAESPVFTEFSIPTPSSGAMQITAGPDGNIWFTEYTANQIGRITMNGQITEFSLPIPASNPHGIAAGSDGNVWFGETASTGEDSNRIGRITPTGAITEFTTNRSFARFYGMAAGPDGNVWYINNGYGVVGRISPSGAVQEFVPPLPTYPTGIAAGPDGNVWFTDVRLGSRPQFGNNVWKVTPSGVFTQYPLPTDWATPSYLTAASDGNIWVTETEAVKVARITPGGSITEFPIPQRADFIARGPDGNVYFATFGAIGRITPAGAVTMFPTPTPGGVGGITSGPDGNVWMIEGGGTKIARMTTRCLPDKLPFGIRTPTGAVQVAELEFAGACAGSFVVRVQAPNWPPVTVGSGTFTATVQGNIATANLTGSVFPNHPVPFTGKVTLDNSTSQGSVAATFVPSDDRPLTIETKFAKSGSLYVVTGVTATH
jgi:streptogramin lyase